MLTIVSFFLFIYQQIIYTNNAFYLLYVVPGKEIDVVGINKTINIEKKNINWKEMIRRSIINKAENIFDALNWDKFGLHIDYQLDLF